MCIRDRLTKWNRMEQTRCILVMEACTVNESEQAQLTAALSRFPVVIFSGRSRNLAKAMLTRAQSMIDVIVYPFRDDIEKLESLEANQTVHGDDEFEEDARPRGTGENNLDELWSAMFPSVGVRNLMEACVNRPDDVRQMYTTAQAELRRYAESKQRENDKLKKLLQELKETQSQLAEARSQQSTFSI
eukprot:5444447-Amphidinium_carterae.1